MKYFNYTKTISAWLKCQMLVMALLATCVAGAQDRWNTPAQNSVYKRTVQWNYGGYTFTDALTFNVADYNYYKELSKTQTYSAYATEHSSHPYLLSLALILDQDAKQLGYKDYTLAAYLVAFVQQAIPYKNDPYNGGYDYPRYPIETIVDQGGDCEDKAALLVALLNTFGFDAILVQTPGHMAAAMACQNCGGYYNYNGKKYSFIETTASGWQIGAVPPNEYVNATLLDVPRPPQYKRGEEMAYTTPEDRSDSNSFGWNNSTNNTGTTVTTITINGVIYQVKGSGSTTIKLNKTTVIITNN